MTMCSCSLKSSGHRYGGISAGCSGSHLGAGRAAGSVTSRPGGGPARPTNHHATVTRAIPKSKIAAIDHFLMV